MKAIQICSLLLLPAGSVLADFAGGDGSAENPWRIATAEQLDEVRNDLAAHYILTADIDLTEATSESSGALWNGGAGWQPIGRTLGKSFIGSLDGNGFKITGLFIDRGGENQAGLFGWTGYGAELTGLALEAVEISGGSLVGGLVVTNFGGTIENSYVTGSVRGNEFVGGLVGRNLDGTVNNSYFTGSASGSDRVGGLVGSTWDRVRNSYATASVSGGQNVGSLVGMNALRRIENSYWNTEASGQKSSSGGGTGLSSAEMRRQASFAGFDFETTWQIRESAAFPVLTANPQDPPPMDTGDSTPSIPPGKDLTGTLPSWSWTAGDGRAVPDLSGDVVAPDEGGSPGSIIDAIRLPEGFDPVEASQDSDNGELSLLSGDLRATVLPYRVRQASFGQEEGVFINEDGDVVLITANRREVSSHPVLADRTVFDSALEELGLQLEYGERATMRLLSSDSAAENADYFSARADMLAMPASSVGEEGVFFRPVPGLQDASVASLVFIDESGNLMQQDLVPAPVDWYALKETLSVMPRISDVRMDARGIISMTMGDRTVRSRMEYEVNRSVANVDDPEAEAAVTRVGDVNGDGTEDFRVLYTGGDTQLLLVFP